MKNTKTKLISSVTVLLICFAMLIGSTFAWFTDSTSTGVNKIQAGNLDIEAYYQNSSLTNDSSTTLYTLPSGSPRGTSIYFENSKNALDGAVLIDENVLFEPGYVGAKLVTVKNVGNLAANIKLQFAVNDNGLASQIWYDFIQVDEYNNCTGSYDPDKVLTTINAFADTVNMPLLANKEYKFIFMYGMKTTADNTYQGKSVDLAVTVLAKQQTEETDSFDNTYDNFAEHDPTIWDGLSVTEVTDNNDVYEINTAAELAWIAKTVNDGRSTFSGKTVKLMKDLNLANKSWTPIGSVVSYPSKTFAGTFDGQGHTISNMYAVDHTANYASAGLFGSITGVVQNLTISSATVISNHYAGGICGFSSANIGMRIENCKVTNSTITSTPELINTEWDNGDKAGGIIGYCVIGDTITGNSIENTTIKGYRDLGGIVGYSVAVTTITNNTVGDNVTIKCDNSHNYKNYSSNDDFDLGDIIGDTYGQGAPDSSNTGTVNKILPY